MRQYFNILLTCFFFFYGGFLMSNILFTNFFFSIILQYWSLFLFLFFDFPFQSQKAATKNISSVRVIVKGIGAGRPVRLYYDRHYVTILLFLT